MGRVRSTLRVNLDFIQEGMRDLELKTTTTSVCTLGVKHPPDGKLVGKRWRIASTSKRLLDRVTLSCSGDHQHHEGGSTNTTCGVLFLMPWPDVCVEHFWRIHQEKKRHWDERCEERGPSHSTSVLHEILSALHFKRFRTNDPAASLEATPP